MLQRLVFPVLSSEAKQCFGKRLFTSSVTCLSDGKEKAPQTDDKGSGWFSRLLGVQQSIEPQKQSHSSMLADKDTVYEIITHDVRPGSMDEYVKLYEGAMNLRKAKGVPGELIGSWTVMIGNQDQAVHLWKYRESYGGQDKVITSVAEDADLHKITNEFASLTTRRRNAMMLPFSYWGEPKRRPPKHIYELRTYTLKPGTMIEWGNNWARGINYRRDFNQDVAGFFSQIGRLYMVFHFWAYDDLAARKKIREETWRKPGWDVNVAYTVPLIRNMDSKIMLPTSYSQLQ